MLIRERMARAMFAVGALKMSSRKAWDTCEQAYRDLMFAEADAALDCLTAPPTEAMVDSASQLVRMEAHPAEIWETMVRTMIEEGK